METIIIANVFSQVQFHVQKKMSRLPYQGTCLYWDSEKIQAQISKIKKHNNICCFMACGMMENILLKCSPLWPNTTKLQVKTIPFIVNWKLLGMNSSAKKDKPSFLEQYAGFWWHFFWTSQGIKLKGLSTSWSKWWRAGAAALKNRFHCRSWLYKSNRIWCSNELEQIHDGSSNPQHFETHPNART